MTGSTLLTSPRQRLAAYGVLLLLAALSWSWNVHNMQEHTLQMAQQEADALLNKDKAYRFWAASHGGVYVPVNQETQPNPYLAHLPNRDVNTTSGLELTLMNPAYILRQTMEQYNKLYGIEGHITSRIHFRKETAPDDWESRQLMELEKKKHSEVAELVTKDGQEYLRVMTVLLTDESCLKCHGHQGYKVGDVRGGVSVSIPMSHYDPILKRETLFITIFHVIFFAVFVIFFEILARVVKSQEAAREGVEHERQALATRLNYIINAAGEGILGLDVRGRHTFVNPAASAMLGFAPEEMIGKPSHAMWHHTHPDGREYHESSCPILLSFTKGETHMGEELFWRKDGTRFPVEYISTPIKEKDAIIGAVVIFKDLSEIIQTNHTLMLSQKKIERLRAHERFLMQILETVRVINETMILSQSEEEMLERSCVHLVEKGGYAAALIGYKEEDIVYTAASHMNPALLRMAQLPGLSDASCFGDIPAGVMEQNKRRSWELVDKEGAPMHMMAEAGAAAALFFPLKEDSFSPSFGVLAIFSARSEGFDPKEVEMLEELAGDIGFAVSSFRRKKTLEEWNASLEGYVNEEIAKRREKETLLLEQSKLAAMGEMMIAVSHHWRQPLTALGLMLQDIDDAFRFNELNQEYMDATLQKANRQIARMSETIDGFSKMVKGSKEKIPFSLLENIMEVAFLMDAELEAIPAGLYLDLACQEGPKEIKELKHHHENCPAEITLLGRPNDFHHMLIGILNNAREAIIRAKEKKKLQGDGRVTIRVRRESSGVEMSISDNGDGIDPEVLERVFEPYFTTEEHRTGIGLFSAKLYVEQELGGYMSIKNLPQGGVEVLITLPKIGSAL